MNISKWLKYISLLGYTTLVSSVELFGLQSAQAQVVIRQFEPRFQTQAQGNISIIGNTLMTCDEGNTNFIGVQCPNVQSGDPAFSGTTNLAANNYFFMNYVDIDTDSSTFNSSSSDLAIPAGATVAWAGLYWSGDLSAAPQDTLTSTPGLIYGAGQPAPNSGINNQAQLQIPGSGYQTITADNLDESGNRYTAYADVTSLVQAAGDGTYTMADVQAGTGGDRYAGWSLIVVYEDPNESLRNLNVYDGFVLVNGSITTTISGFETPPSAGFEVEFGAVAYEGDSAIINDQFKLNGLNLSDGLNPATNFFNSSNTRLGSRFTAKNPDYVNQLAIDIDILDTTGFLNPGDTSASLEFTTEGDVYFPTAFTFATEIQQPVLTKNFTKTVLDVNGGEAVAGDILEYEITVENTGNETATNVIISDPIPDNTTLVDGSLEVVQDSDGSNIGTKTNALNDDTAELNGTDAVFRVGTGATATNGGNLAVSESVTVKFQVQIDPQIDSTSNISNQASVDFNNASTGTAFNGVSDDPSTSPQDDATIIQVLESSIVDYSDAPIDGQSAPDGINTTGYGDASHIIVSGIQLGTIIDAENAAQNSAGADGDDNDSDGDDDDGLTIPTLTQEQTATITADVAGAGGFLQGWIDWDGNGSFDAGEQVAANLQDDGTGNDSTAGDGTLTFNVDVPAAAITSADTFARFRWSTTQDLDTTTAASDGEVEDYQVAIASGIISISGTVFEDINYGGGAGRNFTTAETSATSSGFAVNGINATGINNARVELYSYDGSDISTSKFIEATTTDNDGSYSFDVANGNYLIRVVNNTVSSLRPSNFTGETPLAVQTFRNDSDETTTEITNEVGGANPTVADEGNVTTVDTLLPNDAQSVTAINVSNGSINEVDFGFNFDTIVNTNASGQGSLPQFILNSNELDNTNLAQDLPAAITAPLDKDGNPVTLTDYETSIFMIPDPNNDSRVTTGTGVGEINLSNSPPDGGTTAFVIDTSSSFQPLRILDSHTSIDGRTQTVNIPTVSNTPNLTIGSNETTGAEVIVDKSFGGDIIYGLFSNLIFHSLGIVSQGGANSIGFLLSSNGAISNQSADTSNVIMEELTIATSNCGIQGVRMTDSVIRHSVIRDSGANSTCNNIQLQRNSDRNLIEDNLILRSSHYGINIVVTENNDNIISGNQIVGNGTANANNQTSGIGLRHSTNTTILNNIIRDNVGDGITVTNDSASNTGNLISQNSIYNNGDLGIDLGSGNGGDGVTSNDTSDGDTGANGLQNFPVITDITSDGTNYTIEGTLESTPSDNFEIELYSNAVCNPDTNGAAQTDNYGEGEKYHLTIPVTTDASGQATFSTTVAIADLAGNVMTTTATSQTSNDTSEFSQCFTTTPELILVKRITAINPGQIEEVRFNTFVDDPDTDTDNEANWPSDADTYLPGEISVTDVEPGDEVEYTIYFLSNGSTDAQNVKICDVVPDNMTFVENGYGGNSGIAFGFDANSTSLSLPDTPNKSLSNALDNDEGDFYTPGTNPPTDLCKKVDSGNSLVTVNGANNINGAIVVELNSLPPATSPGNPVNSYGFIRFRAQVK